jgi:hypothetical protein
VALKKMRLVARLKGTDPDADTKMLNVVVSPVLSAIVTVGPGGAMHCAVVGFVRQIWMVSGRVLPPVPAERVMVPAAPVSTVATLKALARPSGTFRIPSFDGVAAMATTFGTGIDNAVTRIVLTPRIVSTGTESGPPPTLNATSTVPNAVFGVIATRKD